MNKITRTSIQTLMGEQIGPVLTLYVPTHRFPTPPNMQEDQTRFKNLLREGCEKWREVADEAVVTSVYNELEAYIDDLSFWQGTIETLAIFASAEATEIIHLPIETEEKVHVGDCFDVTPLLLVESINQPSYVFALAQQEAKLFKADLYGIEEIEADFPKSVEDALNIDEMFANSNTIRNGRFAATSSVPAAPHGQGDSSGAGREERITYLRMLDDIVHKLEGFDDSLPLIIAATDTEFGDFRTISRSKTILDVHIPGNYTAVPVNELHARVTSLLFETLVAQKQSGAIERLGELKGAHKSSQDTADITAAATEGRVESLLLPMIDMTTDSVADGTEQRPLIRFDEQYNTISFDLLNTALTNSAEVIALERGSLPALAPLAATYRY